jgi:DNA-binding transcriptional regulator YhcF (GntR family)
MLIRLDPTADSPLFAQIAAQLRHAIATRGVRVGEQLPPARELAESLNVNMHTVLRAYAAIRDEGLVEMRRGRGVIVLGDGQARAKLLRLARPLVREARRQGLDRDALCDFLEELL